MLKYLCYTHGFFYQVPEPRRITRLRFHPNYSAPISIKLCPEQNQRYQHHRAKTFSEYGSGPKQYSFISGSNIRRVWIVTIGLRNGSAALWLIIFLDDTGGISQPVTTHFLFISFIFAVLANGNFMNLISLECLKRQSHEIFDLCVFS
jgi:hypothetical protein